MLTEGQHLDRRPQVSSHHLDYPSADVTTAADAMLSLRNSTPQSLKMNIHYTHHNATPTSGPNEPNIIADIHKKLSRQNSTSSGEHAQGNANQRKEREFIPDNKKDNCYWVKRHKNNQAAKRSREKRRMNDAAMGQRILELTNENTKIKQELDALKRRFGIPIDQPFLPDDQPLDSPTPVSRASVDSGPMLQIVDNESSDLPTSSSHNNLKNIGHTQSTSLPQSMPHGSSNNSSSSYVRSHTQMPAQHFTSNNNYTSAQSSMPPALIPLNTVASGAYLSSIINSGQGNCVPVSNSHNSNSSNAQNQMSYTGSMSITMASQEVTQQDQVICSSAPAMSNVHAQNQYHIDTQSSQANGYYREDNRPRNIANYPVENVYAMQSDQYHDDNRGVVNCYPDNNNYNEYHSQSGEHSRKNSLESPCESPRRLQICYSSASESAMPEHNDCNDSPLNLTKRKRKASSVGTYDDSSDSEQDDETKRRSSSYLAYSTNANMPLKFRHKINSTEHMPQECFTMQEQEGLNNPNAYRRQQSNSLGSVFSDDGNSLDERYVERRKRNNFAAKKCRENRRSLHELRMVKSSVLESENSQLREELQSLTEEVSQLKDLVKKKRDSHMGVNNFD